MLIHSSGVVLPGAVNKFQRFVRGVFPDRQIIIRGPGRTSALHLSHRVQFRAVCALALGFLWMTGATGAVFLSFKPRLPADHGELRLQAELAAAQRNLAAMASQNSVMARQRAQAVAEADRAVAQADALARAARAQALAENGEIAAGATARIAALDQQTQAAIAQVEGIIRSTGVNPDRVTALPAPAAAAAPAPDGAELLERDLGQLHALSGLLGQMPLASPVDDMSITSGFGYRADPFTGAREFHVGIDLRGNIGSPIYATAPGVVTFAGVEDGYGLIVEIDHGYGLSTRYSHLDKILVQAGDKVALHQVVGLLGNTGWSTGPHLLYETRVDGQPDDPLHFIKVSSNNVQ